MATQHQMDGDDHVYPQPNRDDAQRGITLFYHYAGLAPQQIPDWFKHQAPEKTHHKKPPSWDDKELQISPTQRDRLKAWQDDPCFDLEEDLKYFQDAVDDWYKDEAEWERRNKESRYFQWRGYYAENLITHLNNHE